MNESCHVHEVGRIQTLKLYNGKILTYEVGQIVCWNQYGVLTCLEEECQPWFKDARTARVHMNRMHGVNTSGLEKQLAAYNMAEIVHDVEGSPVPGYESRPCNIRSRSCP